MSPGRQYAGLGALTTMAWLDAPAEMPMLPEYIPSSPPRRPLSASRDQDETCGGPGGCL